VRLVEATPPLQELLARPDVEPERKLEAIREGLGDQFTGTIIALLAALVRHQRGEQVAAVAEIFEELADEAAGVVRAEARTVVPLTEQQRARLAAVLSRATGRRVVLEERIDPGILAGVRVQIGDRLIDGSAAGRLERLREELGRPGL
jgi:F-type H+-transporting ATPase subunit delta